MTDLETTGNDLNGSLEDPSVVQNPTVAPGNGIESKPTVNQSYFTATELQVFKQFVEKYAETREISREDAIALDFAFGPTIQQVFQIIEEDKVTVRKSPVSNRTLIEVCSKASTKYWIPPGHSLCQCMAFIHGKKEYCKHVLAAHLYLAITPPEEYVQISEPEVEEIFHKFLDNCPTHDNGKAS